MWGQGLAYPAGIHTWPWTGFVVAFAWNPHRHILAGGLYRALHNLKTAGCRAAIIAGSFVTSKDSPDDYDAAFDPEGVNALLLDPVLLRHNDGRKAMRATYFGDIFPWEHTACLATGMIYKDYFQQDGQGRAKGVVLIDVQALPLRWNLEHHG
jgi:hypothetical protein